MQQSSKFYIYLETRNENVEIKKLEFDLDERILIYFRD